MPRFECSGCGQIVAADALVATRMHCPSFGGADDVDHVLQPRDIAVPTADGAYEARPAAATASADAVVNPFLKYRHRLTAWRLAMAAALGDEVYVRLCQELDREVAALDGRGFAETPFGPQSALSDVLGLTGRGALWVKDETGNVSGSHKARHLMGVMLYLQVAGRVPRAVSGPEAPPLAIASCGNAALAAAVVARASKRALHVYVPPSANPRVLERLRSLGASVVVCTRRDSEPGDPCYLRFHDAIAAGAVPFCCQGPDNALTIEGGETIVWEMLERLDDAPLDRIFVQVGGGALASACVRGVEGAVPAGARRPRIHAVQTAGAFPLARAWARVALRALETLLFDGGAMDAAVPGEMLTAGAEDVYRAVRAIAEATGDDEASLARALAVDSWSLRACAEGLAREPGVAAALHALREAARERSSFMWPWEREPRSLAAGILDDETYDWRRVVEGMITSGGWPVIVTDAQIEEARQLAVATTSIPVDYTGSAGLAGVLALGTPGAHADGRAPIIGSDERVAVIFSGRER